MPKTYSFVDVYGLDDDMLAMVPQVKCLGFKCRLLVFETLTTSKQPAFALILLFPGGEREPSDAPAQADIYFSQIFICALGSYLIDDLQTTVPAFFLRQNEHLGNACGTIGQFQHVDSCP